MRSLSAVLVTPLAKIAITTATAIAMASGVARAAELSDGDQARIRAGIVLATFDELDSRCARSYSEPQRAEVDRWRASQDVDRVRAHLNGAGLSAELRQQVGVAARQIIQQVASASEPCAAAVGLTRTADAKLADKLPVLLAGSTAMPGSAKPTTQPATPTSVAGAAPPPPSGDAVKIAAGIEGFGFDSCTRIGYGGMVMYVPCPVVLFKNGGALTDVEGLDHPQGMAAHRAANPQKWTQWRREDGRVQLLKAKGWSNITYTAVYSTLPKGFSLDGRYHSMGGGGNTAMGGGQAVAVWSDYLFRPDGTVQRDGGAGSSSGDAGVSVTTSSQAASRRGRYRVDGLILAIDYDDGAQERRIIIADPQDKGKGTMWLDGEGYVYKK
jgi:hypothetical protein